MCKLQRLCCFIFFIVLSWPFLSIGQNKEIYLGLRTANTVLIGLNHTLDSTKQIGGSVNYYLSYYQGKQYWSSYSIFAFYDLVRSLNRSGVGLLVYFQKSRKQKFANIEPGYIQFAMEYRHLTSSTYIDDWGINAGSNESKYREFTDQYNNIALLFSYFSRQRKILSTYIQFGAEYQRVKRQFSVEGLYNDQRSSNRLEYLYRYTPIIRLGVNFKIATLNKFGN